MKRKGIFLIVVLALLLVNGCGKSNTATTDAPVATENSVSASDEQTATGSDTNSDVQEDYDDTFFEVFSQACVARWKLMEETADEFNTAMNSAF